MSTKTIGVVVWGLGWQKVGIELGSYVFHPNPSQPGMFQTFAYTRHINLHPWIPYKHRENRKKLHREHLIGCQGAKLFLLKYVIMSTVATATVTTDTITTVTIWVFWVLAQFDFLHLSQIDTLSFIKMWDPEFCQKKNC